MRVLVFDDDAAIGRLVVRVASMAGMDATAVSNAAAFRERLQIDPPEVVVLDLQLGETDGVEQMHVLVDEQYIGALVLMSGYDARVLATAHAVGESLGLKVQRVLEKPLQVSELERMFERLLSESLGITAARLLEAIVNDELALDFQPMVSRQPRALKKLEALVRWEHPILGRIPPDDFLPMAQRSTAAIDALTEWVVGAVVEAWQVLKELGVSVPLAVNISARNLHDLTLPERLEQRLKADGMPAGHLCLEITESVAFEDPGRIMDILARMRLKGISLSIDDFGTGYSSLKMLRRMPFSEIKIDRSFVGDMTISRDARAIVKSIVDLAANMGMGCVAEGVETEETAELLEQLGVCDLQGYFVARPMPVEDVAAWLAIWSRGDVETPRARTVFPVREPESSPGIGETVQEPPASLPREAEIGKPQLSPRQLEVMGLLSEGCSVKEIARRLNLSLGTVKVHLSLAYSALGARNRVEAVMRAGMYHTYQR
jgi:EAL domain-containing protein (putative c-di-GMP-specific phosphodiesterase class I)/DNA-binding CsgD family transcriptional regulator